MCSYWQHTHTWTIHYLTLNSFLSFSYDFKGVCLVYAMSLQVKVSFFFMTLSSISLSQQQQVAPRLQFTGTLVLRDRSLGLSSPDYMIIPPGERKLRSISYCLCIHPSAVNAASFSSKVCGFFFVLFFFALCSNKWLFFCLFCFVSIFDKPSL